MGSSVPQHTCLGIQSLHPLHVRTGEGTLSLCSVRVVRVEGEGNPALRSVGMRAGRGWPVPPPSASVPGAMP